MASVADSYRWAIAGLVAAVVSGMDFPSPSSILERPRAGVLVLGMGLAILLGIIVFGAVIDHLVFHRLDPRERY